MTNYPSAQQILTEALKTRNICQLNELAHYGFRTKLINLLNNNRVKPPAIRDAEVAAFISKYTKPRHRRS